VQVQHLQLLEHQLHAQAVVVAQDPQELVTQQQRQAQAVLVVAVMVLILILPQETELLILVQAAAQVVTVAQQALSELLVTAALELLLLDTQ
jgi:hypothetical protein